MNKFKLVFLFFCSIFIVQSCYKVEEGVLQLEITADNAVFQVEEEPPVGEFIGVFNASSNMGELRFYLDEESHAGAFTVDSLSGVINVNNPLYYDYETNNVVSGNIKVLEIESSKFKMANVKIVVQDGLDSKITMWGFTESIDEDPKTQLYLGSASGIANKGKMSYSFKSQTNKNAMRIDSLTGAVYMDDISQFDYEKNAVLSGVVTGSNGFASKDANVVINLIDKEEPLGIQERLDKGETPSEIYNSDYRLLDSMLGKVYKGGYLIYINPFEKDGMVAAMEDLSNAEWGCQGTDVGKTYTYVGSGEYNSSLILNKCFLGNIAAFKAFLYSKSSYDDWYLPSRDELNLIHEHLYLKGIGNLKPNANYWSSSEYNSHYAYYQLFNLVKKNYAYTLKEGFSFAARPIRNYEE